ncbi:lipopolysaccharide biosynthesis protein [Vibrio parahaemolyticus]|uniref:lipopolysaccharide biosynthesis protein n=1 Tax=Vibrio parahaemolyticus TaxID=670 RepID=UPI0015D9E358|nr:lipopolysaccharide biosynthesis protein [Vibrio parahaemolyticus]ELA6984967.1 lipopolysaccharide biosynthesis protein [Vibrio parahaemolyticus]MBE4056524.1 lipopolysaccharide biosynthesis protein [Vibrio parahaemolyticus]MBE4091510.1 lipopolysaccharide biosynthesis protein [Vibrio parahaemolyticus]MBE4266443.1 lipopolysaccharide biosynthesis protein [Vibrio parahaemolyticus]MBE4286023.1 lipopolysaccharide biosynthesis protein [Vibrio parahaemolyticus]
MSKAMTNMSLFAIALVFNKSISLLMLPVLPHFLTPEQMGKLELLTTFGVVTTLLVSFALHEALYRFVGVEKNAQKRTVSLNQLYSLSVLIACAVASILLLLIALLPIPEPFTRIEFAVVTLAIVLEGSIAIGTAWLRTQDDKAKTLLQVMVTTTLLQVTFIVAALALHTHVISVLIGGLIAAVMQFVWLHIINRYTLALPQIALAKQYLNYCLPVMLSALVAFCLNGAERWFIGANASLATLGIYAIAVKFAVGMCILVQPFGMWWMPRRFAYLENARDSEAVRVSHLGMIYVAALSVVVATLAMVMITNFLPETYHEAVLYTLFLLPIAMLKEWSELLNIAILFKRRTRWLLGINVVSALVAIGLLFGLSSLGIFGVFIALYYAQLCKLGLTYAVGQQCMTLPFHLSLMVLLQIISGVALFLLHSSQSIGIAIAICILTCSLLAGLAVRYMSKEARSALSQQLIRWRGQVKRYSI